MILLNAFCLGLSPSVLLISLDNSSGPSRLSIGGTGDHPGISLVLRFLLSCCWNKVKHSRSSRVACETPSFGGGLGMGSAVNLNEGLARGFEALSAIAPKFKPLVVELLPLPLPPVVVLLHY